MNGRGLLCPKYHIIFWGTAIMLIHYYFWAFFGAVTCTWCTCHHILTVLVKIVTVSSEDLEALIISGISSQSDMLVCLKNKITVTLKLHKPRCLSFSVSFSLPHVFFHLTSLPPPSLPLLYRNWPISWACFSILLPCVCIFYMRMFLACVPLCVPVRHPLPLSSLS